MAKILVHECGWQSKPSSTPAMAEAMLRRHSCERQRTITARAARVKARKASAGETRECTHKVARHQHGTRAAYVLDLCRCRPCRDATSAAERARTREIAYGRWEPYVDARPARKHCHALMDSGIGLKQIIKLSGVPSGTVWKLVYGKKVKGKRRTPSKRIRPHTAAAILAVGVAADALAGGAVVDSAITVDRLQQLIALGWSQSKLAARLGVNNGNFGSMLQRTQVRASTARAVRALYLELSSTPPLQNEWRDKIAASRARNYAAARGWKPPSDGYAIAARQVELAAATTSIGPTVEVYSPEWVARIAAQSRAEKRGAA